jgi:hypothetical protein
MFETISIGSETVRIRLSIDVTCTQFKFEVFLSNTILYLKQAIIRSILKG